ncbi:hypothetical protein RFI_33491, partial [Reticulomyxa filosa]
MTWTKEWRSGDGMYPPPVMSYPSGMNDPNPMDQMPPLNSMGNEEWVDTSNHRNEQEMVGFVLRKLKDFVCNPRMYNDGLGYAPLRYQIPIEVKQELDKCEREYMATDVTSNIWFIVNRLKKDGLFCAFFFFFF